MKPCLSENAKFVLRKRYLRRENGIPAETPQELFARVAKSVASADLRFGSLAQAEKSEKTFFRLLRELRFLPNSPTLMNAGRSLGQLAACFVLPIEDSIESIFETLKDTAMIHKSGGGTGFSFSRIRPQNDVVLSTSGVSSGPISFMSVFDMATETVKQGGTRRGANMGVLRVDHPDIEAFIQSKNDPSRLNNFNISVALTSRFIEALESGAEYDLINPRTGRSVSRLPAKGVFDRIVRSAWQGGEPGILFIDRVNEKNPVPHLGMIEATNPCGEQPLLPYESCTLGSVNLSAAVRNHRLDFNMLKKTVHESVHFLDNVIDVNRYPLASVERMSKETRKIGLGVMGFADMLIELRIRYDSDEAAALAEKTMGFISQEARKASAVLAMERGNFPAYKGSVFDNASTPWVRNATTTTIAPTGTISIIAGTSSGIEPLFAVAHFRRALGGKTLPEMHPLFVEIAKEEGFFSQKLAAAVAETGSIQGIPVVPESIQKIFRTTHDIPAEWHVKIQAAFQKHTDNGVSKTVNLPLTAGPEEVERVFRLAYQMGCKGVTVYRYGSREQQVLNLGTAVLSRPDAIAQVLKNFTKPAVRDTAAGIEGCSECGNILTQEEGCLNCRFCGLSRCG